MACDTSHSRGAAGSPGWVTGKCLGCREARQGGSRVPAQGMGSVRLRGSFYTQGAPGREQAEFPSSSHPLQTHRGHAHTHTSVPMAVCLPGHRCQLLVLGEVRAGLWAAPAPAEPGAAPRSSRWCRWKQGLSLCLGKQTRLTQPRRGCSACLPKPVPQQGMKHPDLPFTLPPVPFPARFLEVTRVGSAKSLEPSPGLPGCSLGSCESLSSSPAPGPQISASSWGAERPHGEAGGCPVWGNPWTDHGKNFQPLLGHVWWWHKEKPAWPWS